MRGDRAKRAWETRSGQALDTAELQVRHMVRLVDDLLDSMKGQKSSELIEFEPTGTTIVRPGVPVPR